MWHWKMRELDVGVASLWLPSNVHIFIPETDEYVVTLHGERDFAAMPKLRIRRWEVCYLSGFNVISRVLISGRQEGQSQRRNRDRETERQRVGERNGSCYPADFKVRGRDHELKKARASRSYERQGKGFSLQPPEGMQLCHHLDGSPVRWCICIASSH